MPYYQKRTRIFYCFETKDFMYGTKILIQDVTYGQKPDKDKAYWHGYEDFFSQAKEQ
jgi:hypothetical protein